MIEPSTIGDSRLTAHVSCIVKECSGGRDVRCLFRCQCLRLTALAWTCSKRTHSNRESPDARRPADSFVRCGVAELVEDARRRLYEHRITSLAVVNEAGACCGRVSVHGMERA